MGTREEVYQRAVERSLAWLQAMLPAADGSGGVYERYRINIGRVNPWIRPDCCVEVGRLFYAFGDQYHQPDHRQRGLRLAEFACSLQRTEPGWRNGSFPFYLFRPQEPDEPDIGDAFGIPNLPERAWPNDNGKITGHLLWFYEQTGNPAFLGAARRALDYLLRIQAEDGTFSLAEEGEEPGFKGADFTAWPTMALIRGALLLQAEDYRQGALRGLTWLRDHQAPSGRMKTSYETCGGEAWRPPSSETAIALKAFAWGARLFEQEWVRSSLEGLAAELLKWQHESGGIRNCDADARTASLQNDPDVTDLVYTDGYALLALLEAYAVTGHQPYLEAATRLADFLAAIQCWGESPAWDGGWRGSYHLEKRAWYGSADQENPLDEGGMNTVYTGWSAAPIACGMLRLLQPEALAS